VPEPLQGVVGKKVLKRSLGTKDWEEAKRRFPRVLADIEAQWANLRAGPITLTEREAHELAITAHNEWLARHWDNPSEQTFWRTDLFDELWAKPKPHDIDQTLKEQIEHVAAALFSPAREHERWCLAGARDLLESRGLKTDDARRLKLAKAVAAAVQRASLTLAGMARGVIGTEGSPSGTAPRAQPGPHGNPSGLSVSGPPGGEPAKTPGDGVATVTITGLLDGWWREAGAAGRKPSTHESYRNTFQAFVAHLKHDDAPRLTADDVIGFKNHRLTTPSSKTGRVASAKTVKDSDLSALKTVFGWAVVNRKLATNPALGITIKVGKPRKLRSKGFTEAEAQAILLVARDHEPGHETPRTSAAKRWVPWLCAFTGARVGELAQLRKQDVTRQGDHWVIRITPEAGTVKTNEAREVVLHPQLVELGFSAFVEASPEGPLFLTPAKSGDVLGPLQGLKNRLAEFARSVVPDPNVAPNHGWRHRFKTVGMEAGIAPRILDAIQGQAARSVADTYGDVTLNTIAAAIYKLPAVKLDDSAPA